MPNNSAAPVLLFFLLAVFVIYLRPKEFTIQKIKYIGFLAILICIPVLAGILWTYYTDIIKLGPCILMPMNV